MKTCLSSQQVVLKPMVAWGKGSKVIKVPFTFGDVLNNDEKNKELI